jgi:hypothetical protein
MNGHSPNLNHARRLSPLSISWSNHCSLAGVMYGHSPNLNLAPTLLQEQTSPSCAVGMAALEQELKLHSMNKAW